MCVQGSQKCSGKQIAASYQLYDAAGTTQHDAVRWNPTQSDVARRKFATNSQPRPSHDAVITKRRSTTISLWGLVWISRRRAQLAGWW